MSGAVEPLARARRGEGVAARDRREAFVVALHGLRGLAAFGVFVAHCTNGYLLHLCEGAVCESTWFPRASNLGTFGVEFFFLLSGYVIVLASLRSEPGAFLRQRFWRLYPIFILFTLAFFVANRALGIEPEKDRVAYLLLNASFLNLFAGTPALTPNAWTITYEVCFYVLTFGIVYPFVAGRRVAVAVAFGVLAVVFLWRFPISLYYVAGVVLALCNERLRALDPADERGRRALDALEILALATVVVLATAERRYAWAAIAADPSTLALLAATTAYVGLVLRPASVTARWLAAAPLVTLGTVSYTLYLAHPYSYFVSRAVVRALPPPLDTGVPQLAIFTVLVVVSTALTVALVHRCVEVPAYRWGTGRRFVGTFGSAADGAPLPAAPRPSGRA